MLSLLRSFRIWLSDIQFTHSSRHGPGFVPIIPEIGVARLGISLCDSDSGMADILKRYAEKRRLRTQTGADAIRVQRSMGHSAASRAPHQSLPTFIRVQHVFCSSTSPARSRSRLCAASDRRKTRRHGQETAVATEGDPLVFKQVRYGTTC